MAGIIGQISEAPTGGGTFDRLTPALNFYTWDSITNEPFLAQEDSFGGGYSFYRIAGTNKWAPIDGQKSKSFFDDFYNRIHIEPTIIDLGNLVSSKIVPFTVWNAYFVSKLLSNINEIGGEGISLTEPIAAPTTFFANEERTYSLNVTTDGPPVVNAVYSFLFPSETPSVTVQGRRVTLWPFIPQIKHREGMEWRSDIISSFNHEQRLALRAAPRQSFQYEFHLDEQQFSRAKAINTLWSHRVYGIPVWSELTFIGELNSGDTEILFDTAYADYRNNDIIAIWVNDKELAAVEITQVLSDRVQLKLPLPQSYSNAYIAPLRFARTLQGMDYRRRSDPYVIANAKFLVTENADLGASVGYDVYRSKDVMPERSVLLGDLNETISQPVDIFDNGSGPIAVEIKNDWLRNITVLTLDTLNREERWKARQWVHSRRGKQKTFWLPSWNSDLVLFADADSIESSIICLPINYPLYYNIKDIMIQMTDGTQVYNRVLSGAKDGNGNEILSLENQIGIDLTPATVDFICFMKHVRFDTDQIDMQHSYSGRATMSIPVIETPEVA